MKRIAFVAAILLGLAGQPSRAQDTTEDKLDLIGEFAERLCFAIPLDGERREISGKAAAELKGIIRRLVGAGVDGAGKIDVTEYSGFVQEQLLDAVQSSVECRLVIWRDLEKRMFPQEQSATFPCEPPGGLSGNSVERSVTLNNMGTDHARRGEYAEAVACFEQSMRFHVSRLNLENLAQALWLWEDGDRQLALDYADRAVALQREAIRNIDRGQIARLRNNPMGEDCRWRDSFTNEVVSTEAWHLRASMHYEAGEIGKAFADYSEVIDSFPEESCVHWSRVGRALADRALLYCQTGRLDAALADYRAAASLGFFDATASEAQAFLRERGYYRGPLDGDFGSRSMAALEAFARDGCPQG